MYTYADNLTVHLWLVNETVRSSVLADATMQPDRSLLASVQCVWSVNLLGERQLQPRRVSNPNAVAIMLLLKSSNLLTKEPNRSGNSSKKTAWITPLTLITLYKNFCSLSAYRQLAGVFFSAKPPASHRPLVAQERICRSDIFLPALTMICYGKELLRTAVLDVRPERNRGVSTDPVINDTCHSEL